VPLLALAEEELALPCAEADDAPVLGCCEPPPLWVVAPEELVPLPVPVGCGDVDTVLLAALEPALLPSFPEAPADPVEGAGVCCWAGDGLG
jgi:hypothetical protein